MSALLRKTSFRYFVGYLSILIIPILISLLAFRSIEVRLREELEKYGFSVFNQTKISVDEKLYNIYQKSMDIAMDRRVSRFLSLSGQLDAHDIEVLLDTQVLLDRLKISNNYVSDAFFINYKSGFVLTVGGKTNLSEYFAKNIYLQPDGENEWSELISGKPRNVFFTVESPAALTQYIVMTRPVPLTVGHDEEPKGALVILIDTEVVQTELSPTTAIANSSFYIVNNRNNAVITSGEEWTPGIYEITGSSGIAEPHNDRILYYAKSAISPWSYVWLTSIDNLSTNLTLVRSLLLYSLLLAVTLGLTLSLVLTRRNLSSLTDIMRLIRHQPSTRSNVKTEEFENIRQGISMLMQSHQSISNDLDRQKNYLRSSVVAQLLLDVFNSYENLDQILAWSGVSFPRSRFLAVILSIDERGRDFIGYDALLSGGIQNIVTEIVSGCGTIYTCELSQGTICALINTDGETKEAQAFLEQAAEECERHLHTTITVYMGNMVNSMSKISKSFDTARQKRSEAAVRLGVPDVRYAQIERYIFEHFSESNLSLEQVSSQFGISSPYLSSLFKNKHGESFLLYLRHVRVSKAKELLKSNKNLEQIAAEVGYINANVLIRNFKKDVGITPGQYRMQILHNPIIP